MNEILLRGMYLDTNFEILGGFLLLIPPLVYNKILGFLFCNIAMSAH